MSSVSLPSYARWVRSSTGLWPHLCINLLLRVFVKWRMGLRVDVASLRRRQSSLDRRLARLDVTTSVVDCDGVDARWLGSGDGRVILYLHGGAFITRSPALHTAMVAAWCVRLNAQALMVNYRLAPEHPYPAAADDCHHAYRWLLAQGYQANQIVLAGDSAGGNLALATLHRIKAAGEPMPACAVLLSPFVDFTLSGTSMVSNARRDPIFTPAFACAIRACYAPPERFLDPAVSPLFADFGSLPPLLFQTGSTEMLLDDSVRTAARAHSAGVPVTLEIWDRMPHVFQTLPLLPQAHEALNHIAQFIATHTGWLAQNASVQPAQDIVPT